MQTSLKSVIDHILNNQVDGVVDVLDHARQHESWLEHVLVRINSDYEMRRSAIHFTGLLDGVKRAESGITCGREYHISAFADLGQREFLAFAGIVPRAVSNADIVLNDANIRIHGLCALFVTFFKAMDQTNIHAAEKTERTGLRRLGCKYADEV